MPPNEKPVMDMDLVPSREETVIIFDWDDTLLASSFLAEMGYRLDTPEDECSPEVDEQLRQLEASVGAALKLALSYGDVHIVTNAETGWVEMSSQRFIPGVIPLLEKCSILSARSTYEKDYPNSPLQWKYAAFRDKLARCFSYADSSKNVISLGDSHVEREAVRAVTKCLTNTRVKSVKFAERPSMEQLRRQIELVTNCFQYIFNHKGDLDLQLTVTVHDEASPKQPAH